MILDKQIICGIIIFKIILVVLYTLQKLLYLGLQLVRTKNRLLFWLVPDFRNKRKVLNMKKLFIENVALTNAAGLVAFCVFGSLMFSGCNETAGNSSLNIEDTDSSYYSVNYKDTGDPEKSLGNSSANVDHSAVLVNSYTTSSAVSSIVSSVSSNSKKSDTTRSNESGSMVKTTVTFYYSDEYGEHSTDTEVYVMTDTEVPSVSDAVSKISDTDTDSEIVSEPSTDTSTDSDVQPIVSSGEFTYDDLSFAYEGTVISCGLDISIITETLGEPKHITNIPNPNNSEFDIKTYNYDHFSIETAPSDDGSIYTVVGVQIFDDSVGTNKGVKIGMTVEDAIEVYGNDVKVFDDEYRYYVGNDYMYLYVQNGIIANIGYGYDSEIAE